MKLISAKYDDFSGMSYVVIKHRDKLYTGYAHVHPEERHASRFTGCRYAEMRAIIKALKEERAELITKCEECRKFVKACAQYKNWDKSSPTAKAVYRQLNRRIKEVNELTDRITQLQWDLNLAIKQQDSVGKKLAGKRAEVLMVDEVREDI